MTRNAFTLLEILLAMGVLAIGLGAVLQSTSSSRRTMQRAADLTEIQSASISVLNELLAGSKPIQPESIYDYRVPTMPNERIIVRAFPAALPDLAVLRVSVESQGRTQYQLVRWIEANRVQETEIFQNNGQIPLF